MAQYAIRNLRDTPGMADDDVITLHVKSLRHDRATTATTQRHRDDNLRRIARALPVPLLEATYDDLDAWKQGLRVGDSSVRTYIGHLRSFYRWAVDRGLRADNPANELPLPRIPRRLPRPIPEKDLMLAFRCATGDMVVWLALAGWCGLRAGEISRLTGDSIIMYDDGTMILSVDGKGGHQRRVAVPHDMQSLMRGVMVRGPLFRTPSGKPADPRYVSFTAAEFFRSIGLPYVLHQLRHRFGTRYYQLCKDIRETQEIMGHRKPETTAMYVAISESQSVKTQNRLGESFPKKDAA